jgi:hypothetical protein
MADTQLPIPWYLHVVACCVCFAAGALVMYDENKGKPEPPAPAIVQKDGSRILERNPAQPPPSPPMIPKGSKVIRITTATIAPRIEPIAPQSPGIAPKTEETIQITEIQAKDGTTRQIASTNDGTIIGGSDWTQPSGPPAKVYHWEAQAIRAFTSVGGPLWGASLAYTRGPVVASVAVIPGTGGSIQAGLGFRW